LKNQGFQLGHCFCLNFSYEIVNTIVCVVDFIYAINFFQVSEKLIFFWGGGFNIGVYQKQKLQPLYHNSVCSLDILNRFSREF
jgi:hypothetical protein